MSRPTVALTLRITPELSDALRDRAIAVEVSVNALVERLLLKALAK